MAETKIQVPTLDEVPKLRKMGAGELFDEATALQRTIKQAEARLAELRPILASKLAAANVPGIDLGDSVVMFKDAYSRKTFDTDWAKKTLVKKGVSMTEIDKHYKETEIKPTVVIKIKGGEDE